MSADGWVGRVATGTPATGRGRGGATRSRRAGSAGRTLFHTVADTLGNGWIWLVAAAIVVALIRSGA